MNTSFALETFETLLRATLWSSVAIGVALIVCFFGRNHLGAAVRAWIWRIALAKMVLGVTPLSPIALSLLPPVEKISQPRTTIAAAPTWEIAPKFDSFQPTKNLEVVPKTAPALPEAPASMLPRPKFVQRDVSEAKFEAPLPVLEPFRPNWPLIALVIWMIGALVQTIQLARGYNTARNLRRDACPLENELAASLTAQCCARMGVRGVLQLAKSTAGPLLLGAFRPLILLPEPAWRTWNEAELRLVLCHEVAHHKRADLSWNFLLGAAQVLFWFHPLFYVARRQWRACAEQACDEMTLSSTQAPPALYGALLLRLATQNVRSGPAMVGVSEDFALLQGRLMVLKNLSSSSRKWPRFVVAMVLGMGALSLLPWQLTARAQTETARAQKSALEGTLRDTRGRIVANAEIFTLGWRGAKPFLQTDRNGYYRLSGPSLVIPDTDLLYVKGQTEGFARFNVVSLKGKIGFSALQWLPTSVPKIVFVDEKNRPVKNWEMRVWSVGPPSHLRPLPPFLRARFSARTNARGEISFPALPQGMTVQLESGDTDWVDTYYGLPNRRGARFAPLIQSDLVALQGTETRHTIRLLEPATLSGQVKADGDAPGVPILASFLEAGEAADQSIRSKKRHRLIASMLTDAKGRYQMKGLRPGRYSLYIFPKDNLPPRYTGQFREFVLHSGPNTANLQFTTGARVQGRVISAKTGRPVAGQTLGLIAPDTSPRYEISRADGSFDFHVAAGKQHFWVAANRTNSPPRGYGLPAQNKFDFRLKEGEIKTFSIQLPGAAATKPITGRVLGPDGLPVAGATVSLMTSFCNAGKPTDTVKTDANGAFQLLDPRSVPAADLGRNFEWGQLFVDAGTRGMAFQNVTLGGLARVEMKLAPTSAPRLTFVDENSRPVADVGVRLWKIGVSSSQWNSLPDAFLKKFVRRTDARGEVSFPPLPQGRTAQFMLADEREVPGKFMDGDHRGGRFAPLSTEDFVTLNGAEVRKTIRLLSVANLSGVVKVTSSGAPVGNVQVVARRINAAEARGDIPNRDMLMASTRSNAQGVYRLDGLRPGNYYLWLYPEKRLTRDYASSGFQKPLVGGQNRVDFPLSKGAIIEGRVVSAATGLPVRGQTLGLDAPDTNSQYEISRADGTFRFRTGPGKQHFWVHGNGQNSPPSGYILPAQNKFDFRLKEGQTKTFLIQLPGTAATKPITGRVVGPDGAPVAGAEVEVGTLSGAFSHRFGIQVKTDSEGRFLIPAAKATKPTRLLAASGELKTARGTVALAGGDVTLKLESGVGVTITGRVVDARTKTPLRGVTINLTIYSSGMGRRAGTTKSDDKGQFEFSGLRPRENYALSAARPNYAHFSEFSNKLSGIGGGERREITISMQPLGPANSFVKGRVLNFDGTPAVGLPVRAQDANPTAYTDKAGYFTLRGIPAGPLGLFVFQKGGGGVKTVLQTLGIGTEAGRSNLVIRLDAPRNKRQNDPGLQAIVDNKPKIGEMAPQIRAQKWFNSAPLSPSSLRGQVVLLDFQFLPLGFWSGAQPEVEEIARAFAARGLRVIGIQSEFGFAGKDNTAARIESTIRQIGLSYPIALDAVSANPLGIRGKSYPIGATTRAYGMTARVVIDRAGRVAYAGDSLSDAVSVAAGLLAAK